MKRSERILEAFEIVDERDKGLCVVCRMPSLAWKQKNDRAHVFPRNNPIGKADDPDGIMTLCRRHHNEYDQNKTHLARIKWLKKNLLDDFSHYAIAKVRLYTATRIVTRSINKIVDNEIN